MMTGSLIMSKIKAVSLHYLILLLLPAFVMGDAEDDEIGAINSKHCSWKAGKYTGEVKDILENEVYSIQGLENEKAPTLKQKGTYRSQIPRHFDSRTNWYHCYHIIDYRRHQGRCSSCWANAAASMIGDRICIGSGGNIQKLVSVEDLVTCCRNCTEAGERCKAGYAFRGLQYWIDYGVVSGGNYRESNSEKKGCKPYSSEIFNRNPPDCERRCRSGYHRSYEDDKNRGKIAYKFENGAIKEAQRDILYNGPIIAFMTIYSDYRRYKSGVYEHVSGGFQADHFVKIIGWGVEEGKPYWLIANSYGREWGEDEGMFKIVRGKNDCRIEQHMRGARLYGNNRAREWLVDNEPSSFVNINDALWLKCFYLILLLLCLN